MEVLSIITSAARKDKNLMNIIKSFKSEKEIPLLSPCQIHSHLIKTKLYSIEEIKTFSINQIKLIDKTLKHNKFDYNVGLDFLHLKEINEEVLSLLKKIINK